MKRRDLIHHLEENNCRFVREGAKHSWYAAPDGHSYSAIPRHREIVDFLVRKICRELGVPDPQR
ncbi:MAG: type II toxin-antitoxin system HicA family toxin [Planctomycetes bacterium]|nr:type II toxin-antitoxin system HicA family toxin [Planctomycetota bacterium]MBI3846711.1 type II toxin-antitoxin system HicA family toxin [Planctomycetota bacterium]